MSFLTFISLSIMFRHPTNYRLRHPHVPPVRYIMCIPSKWCSGVKFCWLKISICILRNLILVWYHTHIHTHTYPYIPVVNPWGHSNCSRNSWWASWNTRWHAVLGGLEETGHHSQGYMPPPHWDTVVRGAVKYIETRRGNPNSMQSTFCWNLIPRPYSLGMRLPLQHNSLLYTTSANHLMGIRLAFPC